MLILTAAVMVFLAVVVCGVVRFDIKGHGYGLFVLKGNAGSLLDIQDDLFLGDGPRLLAQLPLAPLHELLPSSMSHDCTGDQPCLDLEWDEAAGDGWVLTRDGAGGEMHFFFSRLRGDSGDEKHGLFVGGSLPETASSKDPVALSDSGVSYHDGRRSWHIWCNANESIASADLPQNALQPASWAFLGSRVLQRTPQRIVLGSRHQLLLDGVPVRIDRYAYFYAGRHSFDLGIHIVNIGQRPTGYYYTYSDEPWLGDFGSAAQNYGWTREGLVYEEGPIDSRRNTYAGMIDLKYGLANFIAWNPLTPPSLACFSNAIGRVAPASAHVPLRSNERSIGLQWGPRLLRPGERQDIVLTIGMATLDPGTRLPRPEVAAAPFHPPHSL